MQWSDSYPYSFESEECMVVLDMSNKTYIKSIPSMLNKLLSPYAYYFFGGKAANVAPDATAIGPQYRRGTRYDISPSTDTCEKAMDATLSSEGPLMGYLGAALNHWRECRRIRTRAPPLPLNPRLAEGSDQLRGRVLESPPSQSGGAFR